MNFFFPSQHAGQLIAGMRKHSKMTQQHLADAVGLKRGSIANIEAGFDAPSITTIEKICMTLGFELSLYAEDTRG